MVDKAKSFFVWVFFRGKSESIRFVKVEIHTKRNAVKQRYLIRPRKETDRSWLIKIDQDPKQSGSGRQQQPFNHSTIETIENNGRPCIGQCSAVTIELHGSLNHRYFLSSKISMKKTIEIKGHPYRSQLF